jgi:hypothetical protein
MRQSERSESRGSTTARSTATPRARLLAALAALAVFAGVPVPAAARSEKTLAYQRAEVWPAVVRFLVVDERLKITEKDADAGYVLFELRDDGKTFRGSLEVVTVVRDGRSAVRCVLQIADRPSWLEIAMLARLETKLRVELGAPPPPPSKDPPRTDAPRDPPKDAPKDLPKDPPTPDIPGPTDHPPPVSPTP